MIPAAPPAPPPPPYLHAFISSTHTLHHTQAHIRGGCTQGRYQSGGCSPESASDSPKVKTTVFKVCVRLSSAFTKCLLFVAAADEPETKIQKKKITIISNGICREPRSRSGGREAPAARFWRLPPTVSDNNGPLAAWSRRPSRVSQRV